MFKFYYDMVFMFKFYYDFEYIYKYNYFLAPLNFMKIGAVVFVALNTKLGLIKAPYDLFR